MLTQAERGELEALMDAHSLTEVLHALVEICHEKSERKLKGKDYGRSAAWTRAAAAIRRFTVKNAIRLEV